MRRRRDCVDQLKGIRLTLPELLSGPAKDTQHPLALNPERCISRLIETGSKGDLEERSTLDREVDVCRRERSQLINCVNLGSDCVLESVELLAVAAFGKSRQQGVAVGKMLVWRRDADASAASDFREREAAWAALTDELERRLLKNVSKISVVMACWPSRGVGHAGRRTIRRWTALPDEMLRRSAS